MFQKNRIAAACLLAVGMPCAAHAQSSSDLEDIRRQIQELRATYEKRIEALEKRLQEAETAARQADEKASRAETAQRQAEVGPPAATAAAPATPEVSPGGQVTSNAFNPGISLILQGAYRNASRDPETRSITGYIPAGSLDLPRRGFSLDESEITFSANVDHLFYGQATFALHDSAIETEEAYVQTLALGHGLTLKAGRMFSSIGYQNGLHPHAWDFADPALPQRAFLGENFKMDGVQASWIAPLPVFVEVGAELGMPVEFPFADSDANKNGISGGTLFAHLGGDVGESHSYRVGGWHLKAQNRVSDASLLDFDRRVGGISSLSGGDSNLWGLDFVWKWAPNGNSKERNFKLVAEWMQRHLDGDMTTDLGGGTQTGSFKAKQSGWYVQAVYQFLPQWRAGLRYDQLGNGSYSLAPDLAGLVATPGFTPKRYAAMLDWNPSEFSRVRLQYNRDRSELGLTDDQIFLQYIFSLGAHGAHRF